MFRIRYSSQSLSSLFLSLELRNYDSMLGKQMLTCEYLVFIHTHCAVRCGRSEFRNLTTYVDARKIYNGKVTLLRTIISSRKMSSPHTQLRELISLCDLHAKSSRIPNTGYGPATNSSCRTLCYYLLSLSLLPMRLQGWLPGMPTTHTRTHPQQQHIYVTIYFPMEIHYKSISIFSTAIHDSMVFRVRYVSVFVWMSGVRFAMPYTPVRYQ